MKTYAVKEIFHSLQGEGHHVGRPAVFCRFAGCNLGYSTCSWCDTDWTGTDGTLGGKYSGPELVRTMADLWGPTRARRWAVLTGGEPMLQVDTVLLDAFHRFGFGVQIETNGTIPVPLSADWITVSPKAGSVVVQRTGQELKLVYPQSELSPGDVAGWEFRHRYLQPLDGPDLEANTRAAVAYCLAHPEWSVSLQVHKILGIR